MTRRDILRMAAVAVLRYKSMQGSLYKPTEADRNLVRTMIAGGIPRERVAGCVGGGITEKTLRKHFAAEINTSADTANAVAVNMLFQAVQRGEAWAVCFWLKCRAGWRETTRTEVTGTDGGAIESTLHVVYEDKSVPA